MYGSVMHLMDIALNIPCLIYQKGLSLSCLLEVMMMLQHSFEEKSNCSLCGGLSFIKKSSPVLTDGVERRCYPSCQYPRRYDIRHEFSTLSMMRELGASRPVSAPRHYPSSIPQIRGAVSYIPSSRSLGCLCYKSV